MATVTAGFSLTPFRRINAAAKARQGLALCLGLNNVDSRYYNGWNGVLAGCINDSKQMEQIATAHGFYDVKRLNDVDANIKNVRSHIAWAANDLRPGDIFMLSCSSHGSFRTDDSGDEIDGRDETICLSDGQWPDDDRLALFSRFAKGVRVLLIVDACHSGTTYKAVQALDGIGQAKEVSQGERGLQPATRDLSSPRAIGESHADELRDTVEKELVGPLKEYAKLLKPLEARSRDVPRGTDDFGTQFNLPDKKPSPIRAMPDALALYLSATQERERAAPKPDMSKIGAHVVAFAACKDSQTALDGASNGVFTNALKRAWNNGKFHGDYDKFFETLEQPLRNLVAHQPQKATDGNPAAGFSKEQAFQVH
jgi:hypothetical protein